VVNSSKPTLEKELRAILDNLFLDFGLDEIKMTSKDIQTYYGFKKYETSYIDKICSENLKVARLQNEDGKSIVCRYDIPVIENGELKINKGQGRPWVFKREQFTTEIVEINPVLESENKALLRAQSGNANTDFEADRAALADEIINL
jgi:hypothetical protein